MIGLLPIEANSLLMGIAMSSLYSYSCRVCCGLCKLLCISLPSLDPVRMGIALACGYHLHSRLDGLAGRVLVLGACSLSWPLCNHPVVNLHSGVPLGYTRVSTPAI